MDTEMMDLEQLAAYLHRDVREVTKLASRGHLPGQKIGGQWRFSSTEIHYWLEKNLHGYDEAELTRLETGAGRGKLDQQPLVTSLLSEQTMAVPLQAGTKGSVLREMVKVAEQSWHIYDADDLLKAIQDREEMGSTALDNGVALPHPHRPLPAILGDSVLAFGRTHSPVPFGGPGGGLCDLFFLLCCKDHRTHLKVLARLTRMLRRPELVVELRAAESAGEAFGILETAERAMSDG